MSFDWLPASLAEIDKAGLRRHLADRSSHQAAEITLDGQRLLNFGSNDYLDLAADPRITAAVKAALDTDGWGAGASPLITGHSQLHRELETALAEFEESEAALLFPTGFAANVATITSLVGPGDHVFSDAKNHASIIDGCRLSSAAIHVYQHRDADDLNRQLQACTDHLGRKLIVTDGLFSMDGDIAPLRQLAESATRHGAMLMVDEAHATGVLGPYGRGSCELTGIKDHENLVIVGTLSKALGSHGGFVAGPQALIDWITNRGRPFIFSTAAPAALCAAGRTALQIIQNEPERRTRLLELAGRLRQRLRKDGWRLAASVRSAAPDQSASPHHEIHDEATPIIPVFIGAADSTVQLSAQLRAAGILAPAIRPPSVPENESLLRISLSAGHTWSMLERLADELCAQRDSLSTLRCTSLIDGGAAG